MKYIDHVLPLLYEALNNHSEYQICAAAVGVVGDLSRSLLEKLTPYCDQIMTHLLTCLSVSFHLHSPPIRIYRLLSGR